MKFTLSIIDWQARAPGLGDAAAWQDWSRQSDAIDPAAPLAKLTDLPMMTARRLNSGSRLAVDIGLAMLRKHQIDAVVYSCDFPWGIDLGSDVAKFTEDMQRQAAARAKDAKAVLDVFHSRLVNGGHFDTPEFERVVSRLMLAQSESERRDVLAIASGLADFSMKTRKPHRAPV